MAKYEVGDRIVINIRGIEEHPSGILFYEIDPREDGVPRYISESTMDKIVQAGGDVYKVSLVNQFKAEEVEE